MTTKKTDPKAKILATYTKLAKKHRIHPTTSSMVRSGITRNMIRHHFGSISKLHDVAKVTSPDIFASLNNDNLFSPERLKQVKDAVGEASRFVITTAVTGQKVHKGFLNALRNYCKVNDAKLLILTATDPASNREAPPLDEELSKELIVGDDLALNKNLFISSIKLSAKQIDPVTGLQRLGRRDGSIIYASPKQRLRLIPTSHNSLPGAMMTTGACTIKSYTPDHGLPHAYMSKRTATLAAFDHKIGALIVEIDGSRFHYRQVQADHQGRFAELAKLYSADKVVDYKPCVLVLGDWHSAQNSPVARELFVEGINSLTAAVKPDEVVLHDLLDSLSINLHNTHDRTLRAQLSKRGELSLEKELRTVAADLTMFADHFNAVTVVRSNHDDMLDRWLKEGAYINDPLNHHLGARLAVAAIDGHNPLEWIMEQYLSQKVMSKIHFLSIDEDYNVAGVELSVHGHLGANGARGSLSNIESSVGSCYVGHSHTPQILRDAWQVGTCSLMDLGYNKGASSWLWTSGLLYPNGSRQLINIIDGKWRA